MRPWGASGRHTWAGGYPRLGTAPCYSLNLLRVTWISLSVRTGCSPQCPQGALQLERSPCSHKPSQGAAADANRASAAASSARGWNGAAAGGVRLLSGGQSLVPALEMQREGFSCPEVLSSPLCLRAGSRGEGGWAALLLNRLLLAPYAICTPTEGNQPPRGSRGDL